MGFYLFSKQVAKKVLTESTWSVESSNLWACRGRRAAGLSSGRAVTGPRTAPASRSPSCSSPRVLLPQHCPLLTTPPSPPLRSFPFLLFSPASFARGHSRLSLHSLSQKHWNMPPQGRLVIFPLDM